VRYLYHYQTDALHKQKNVSFYVCKHVNTMAKSDMLNKYIFTSYKRQIKIILLFFLCDAMLNDISTAPTSEVITAAMLEPQTGGKRERDLEQMTVLPSLVYAIHFFQVLKGINHTKSTHNCLKRCLIGWRVNKQCI